MGIDAKKPVKRSLSNAQPTTNKHAKVLTLEEKNAIERKKKRQQNIKKAMRKVVSIFIIAIIDFSSSKYKIRS